MNNPSEQDQRRKWQIDRTIPLAIVGTIILQTVGGIVWMSTFAERTTNKIENLEVQQKVLNALPERMVKQESQLESAVVMLKDIKNDVRDLTKSRSAR